MQETKLQLTASIVNQDNNLHHMLDGKELPGGDHRIFP
jgi:hypothetical protein